MTSDTRQRFMNSSRNNLNRLHKNIYINRSDPHYHEKVLRYQDPHSPEAHYGLGRHFEQQGLSDRALYHYNEAMRTYPSPYYYEASAAVRRMTKPETARHPKHESSRAISQRRKPEVPSFVKILLMVLLCINLLLLALFYAPAAIAKVVSSVKPWGIGTDVTYETIEAPFLMNFAYDEPAGQIEKALQKKAVELAHTHPKQGILIYGVASSVAAATKQALPLSDLSWKDKAFVVAEYNPLIDGKVKIRFLQPPHQKLRPLTEAAVNIVRTALQAYMEDNGSAPPSVERLHGNYPGNYLSFIPIEASSGSAEVRAFFDGSGGWVYDPSERELERMFYPNVSPAIGEDGGIPFNPVQLIVDKARHSLLVTTGPVQLGQYTVGLGADNGTPAGVFSVKERVISPNGSHPDVYGAAAFGLGAIAIHGTSDPASVGQDRSLGCIRLANEEMAALFPYVPKGARVEIRDSESSKRIEDEAPDAVTPIFLLPHASPRSAINESAGRKVFHWLG